MRILYLSQYFPPEVGATQTRAYEMARGLVKAGHHVTMIAEFPNHPSGIIPPEYRRKFWEHDTLDNIEIIRVWVKASPVKNFRNRIAFYISYMLMAAMAGLFLARGKFDAIYATSPPLFVGGAALVISYLRRIPLFFEVRDLWPESAVALGELRNPTAIKIAEKLENACYHRAQKVIVVTTGIHKTLTNRGVPDEKIAIIPNGANTELFYRHPNAQIYWQQTLVSSNKFIVLYAGIHGVAQGLETIVQTAQKLKTHKDILFLFVGEGPEKTSLMAKVENIGLENVIFHPEISRSEMPVFLSAANVALVPLKNLPLFKGALPSKMFDAWACECPTIVSVDGEARQVLEKAQAGISVEPENPDALAKAILYLKENSAIRQQMGKNGRKAVVEKYSRQAQAQQLEHLLTSTLKD